MTTVNVAELSNLRMTASNEEKYPMVIQNDNLKEWVGIGWVHIRLATDEDRKKYPTVED